MNENTVMDDAGKLPTGQPAKSQNNNHDPNESTSQPPEAGSRPLQFRLDCIKTKKINLQELVNKFKHKDSRTVVELKK